MCYLSNNFNKFGVSGWKLISPESENKIIERIDREREERKNPGLWIKRLHEDGHSTREIAEITGFSKSKIGRILKKLRE